MSRRRQPEIYAEPCSARSFPQYCSSAPYRSAAELATQRVKSETVVHLDRLISTALIVAEAAILITPSLAQELGDLKRGLAVAVETCAACHGVRRNEKSIDARAPTFTAIAAVNGMSAMALNVALQSPHRAMPNIMLDPRDRADVIAYILCLQSN